MSKRPSAGKLDMTAQVELQVDLKMEEFSTQGTGEQVLVDMCFHVRVQVRCSVKGFATGATAVWLYCGVGQLMTSQVTWLPKSPATFLTGKRLLPGMYSL